MLKIGDKVTRRPVWATAQIGTLVAEERQGVVVYINRSHRWYTVEYTTRGGKIREGFKGV